MFPYLYKHFADSLIPSFYSVWNVYFNYSGLCHYDSFINKNEFNLTHTKIIGGKKTYRAINEMMYSITCDVVMNLLRQVVN